MRQSDSGGGRLRADTHQICLVFIQTEADADEMKL